MMTNEKVVRNFILDRNHYNIFPLAAIFDPPKSGEGHIVGIKYGRQEKNVIMVFI